MSSKGLISVLLCVLMFNFSCANPIASCYGPARFTDRVQDATIVPLASFAYVESNLIEITKDCKTRPCEVETKASFGSGSFVFRALKYPSVAFVMTANHLCKHRNDVTTGSIKLAHRFAVYDYHGQKHEASYYFSSERADVCILAVSDVGPEVSIAQVADSMPARGSRVYNVAAPKAYFNPDAVLIFEGIYSGMVNDKSLFTVPTMPGSSGSPVFDQDGHLISMIIGIPILRMFDGKDLTEVRVVESLGLAESIDAIRDAVNSIESMDQVFGISMIPTTTTATVSKGHSL